MGINLIRFLVFGQNWKPEPSTTALGFGKPELGIGVLINRLVSIYNRLFELGNQF
jgi:hypothetical protein